MSRHPVADAAVADGRAPVWLVTLTVPDGRAIRVSTEPVEVTPTFRGSDGPYSFEPFLVGISDFEEELDYFALEGSASLTQATVELATTQDLAALQGDWYAISASTVEVALIWEGMAWEDRQIVLGGGRVQNIEFGLVGQTTSFSIEAGPSPTSESIGDDTLDVGLDFPDTLLDTTGAGEMSSLVGNKYIWVYGDPESVPVYKVGEVGGSGMNQCVIAGHKFPRNGASYDVSVTEYIDDIPQASVDYTVTNSTAPVSGEPYAYIEHATNFASADGAYTYSAVYGGIASAIDVAAPALGAREVLRRLLVDSGLPVDWRRMQPALDELGSWRIGFYLDQESTAIDVVRDRLLQVLPLVEVNSGDGLWFAFGAPERLPLETHLTLGQELLGRTSRMATTDLESIRNSFTLNYWLDAATGEYTQSVSLGPDESALCALSQQLYGVREDDVIESSIVWDAVTARRILHHRATRFALPRRVLEYQASSDLYWLEAGMAVLLTDPGYGIAGHRGVISVVSRSSNPMTVRIELVDRTPTSRD